MASEGKLEIMPESWERALAVAAHLDDMEYGAASAVARWTSQGKQVAYRMVTRGEAGMDAISPEQAAPLREAEERESAKVVGVQTIDFLDYPDGVVEYGLPLRRDIARAIRRHRPDLIITGNMHLTYGRVTFNMADHRAVGLATLDAARDAGNRWIFPELLQEGLEPWDGVRMVCLGGSPDPTHAVDVTDFIDKGVASLEKHRLYIDNLSTKVDPDERLRWNASVTGEAIGCDYAVSFEVLRL